MSIFVLNCNNVAIPPLAEPPVLVSAPFPDSQWRTWAISRRRSLHTTDSRFIAIGCLPIGRGRVEPRSSLRYAPPLAFRFAGRFAPCSLSPIPPLRSWLEKRGALLRGVFCQNRHTAAQGVTPGPILPDLAYHTVIARSPAICPALSWAVSLERGGLVSLFAVARTSAVCS